MKRIYLIIISCLIFVACKDECDHGFETSVNIPDILVGSWYEETTNEEDVFSASGSLYGKFSNTLQAGETYGLYTVDTERNRLTYTFTATNGATSVASWKLSNVSRFQYTQTSDYASFTLGKIVETYQLEVGEERDVVFARDYGYEVLGYESTNARIASVDQEGHIKAEGEKGTAYIKVKTAAFNVWVKVVIGESRLDLWYDYPSLIGMTKEELKQVLGVPTSELSEGTMCTYSMRYHDYIQQVSIYFNGLTKKVDQIHLNMKLDCPVANIESYLASRYYFLCENEENRSRLYGTFSDEFSSKVIVQYYLDDSRMYFYENVLWDDFTCLFSGSSATIKSEMEKVGYSFYNTSTSYSLNGSDSYTNVSLAYASTVTFVFNQDDVASEYFVYYHCEEEAEWKSKTAYIWAWLNAVYQRAEKEESDDNYVFYNENRSLRIVMEPNKQSIKYTDLTLAPVARNMLGDYWKGLGQSRSSIASEFGVMFTANKNYMVYDVNDEYIDQCLFWGAPTELCIQVWLDINEDVLDDSVIQFLDSKHTRYVNNKGETELVWIDEEKRLYIIYDQSQRRVVYKVL